MVGSAVGPYRIVQRIGAGGMGEVFLGHDPRLERHVALKCLTPAASSGDGHARVLREARAAARLTHSNIAGVYDVLEQDGRTFIVMEYVEGISLAARLAGGPLAAGEVRRIGRQLASALGAAHAQGVIHRDLKPANIQVMRDGSIKVLDFGVAKMTPVIPATLDTTMGEAPGDRTFGGNPGTPIYMAPEQLAGRPLDPRCDLYAAGLMLFLMATGRRPYPETSAVALALAIADGPPPPAHAVNPLVPLDLSAVIAKALERDPAKRFQTAGELEAALTTAESETLTKGSETRRDSGTSGAGAARSRRWWTMAAAAGVLVAGGIAARGPLMTRLGYARPAALVTRPVVLAILPVDNPGGDPQAGYLGAGIASVVSQNFSAVSGLTVVSNAATRSFEYKRDDLAGLRRETGADFVLDLALRGLSPKPRLVVRLRRVGAAEAGWDRVIEGDPLELERALLDGLGRALVASRAMARPFSAADWARIRRLPTTSGGALMKYSEARALLDRSDVTGNAQRAVVLLQAAIREDPSFALAYAAMSDAYWRRYAREKDRALVDQATAAAADALRLDAGLPDVHASLANMYYQTGDNERAAQALRRALDLQHDNDAAHRLLGLVRSDRGDIDGALAELREAIRIRPDSNNYYALGFTLFKAGRNDEAIAPFRTATELAPESAAAFQALGTVLHQLGEIDQAIGNYEHAVRLGPNAPALANLALAYFGAKRYDEALATYEKSLALDPKSVLNNGNIGDVYAALGRTREAKAAYEKSIDLGDQLLTVNPRDARTIGLIAQREAKLGRSGAATRHAAEALALAPKNREILQRNAEVHALLGDRDAAVKDLELAIANGYGRRQARENEELAPLRQLPQFKRLVADAPGGASKER